MDIPPSLIAAFPPSEKFLLERVRRHIDDAMLVDIARADYGDMADEMFAELLPIRDTGRIRYPVSGMLQEVLALTRWCNPDQPEKPPFEPGPTGRRGHYTRLFACAVILQGSLEEDIDSTLARTLESTSVLGKEMSDALGSFLTWWQQKVRPDYKPEDSLFVAAGLLILAIRLRTSRFTEHELGAIADWVLTKEVRYPPGRLDNPFRRPAPFSIQQGIWPPLIHELNTAAAEIRDGEVREKIQLCGCLFEL